MEGLLSTNEYKSPKVLKGKEEIVVLIIRLLLLEPGSNPLHPNMGVGLMQKYRYCTEDDIPNLQLDIKKQMTVYLPEYQQTDVIISYQNKVMRLSISIDDTLYKFTTSDQPAEDEMSLAGLE